MLNQINFIMDKLDDLKAKDIQHFAVGEISPVTDNMIICTGNSNRHVQSLAQYLIEECKKAGIDSFGDEGRATADWIVVDFGQIMVHVMQQEARELYQLEKLWH